MKIYHIRKLLIYVIAVYIAILSVRFFRKEVQNRSLTKVDVWEKVTLEKIDGQEVSLQKISGNYKLLSFGSLQTSITYSIINKISTILEEVNQKKILIIPIVIFTDFKDEQLKLNKEYLNLFFDSSVVLLGGNIENIQLLQTSMMNDKHKTGSTNYQFYFLDDKNRVISVFEEKQPVEEIQKQLLKLLKKP